MAKEESKFAITTRISRQKSMNADPVWGYNKQKNDIRVLQGTSIPNSSIRAKIIKGEQNAKKSSEKIVKKYSVAPVDTSSEEEDPIFRRYSYNPVTNLREKSLEELKVLNNLLKKANYVKKPKPKPSSRYETMIEAIKESKRKLQENENVILEEPEPYPEAYLESESISSIITEESSVKIKKTKIKKTKMKGKKKSLQNKTISEDVESVEKEETTKESVSKKKKKIKKKKKANPVQKKPSPEPMQGSNGILPLRSSQDFSTTQVMTYLSKRQPVKTPI